MKRISLKGVAIGNLADIVSTNVVLLPVIIYIAASTTSGSPPVHGAGSTAEVLTGSTAFLVSSSVLGGMCSVLGGYVSARIAKHNEVLNGSLSSILCVGGGLYAMISGSAASHFWLHLAYLPLSPALGAIGGFLRSRQNARHELKNLASNK